MSTTSTLETYFTRLDAWRHLPHYCFEPRVDVFFSLYLKEALEAMYSDQLLETVIPELPIQKALLYSDQGYNYSDSVKVDFTLISANYHTAYLVELKTDIKSEREKQNNELLACCNRSFYEILDGIVQITIKTEERRKYMHLLHELQKAGLLQIPQQAFDLAYAPNSRGISAALRQITIDPKLQATKVKVVKVKPLADENDSTISFKRLYEIVRRHEDLLSTAFAGYLLNWAQPAGSKSPMHI